MKLGTTTLLAIVEIVRKGLTEGMDISQMLRDLDIAQNPQNPELLEVVGMSSKGN